MQRDGLLSRVCLLTPARRYCSHMPGCSASSGCKDKDQTSMLESPVQENSSTHPARSERLLGRHVVPCLESTPAPRATGASDTAPRAAHFYGCCGPQLYNCERPHSALAYRTPDEFRRILGYGNVESKERFPHLHSPDYDGEIYSPTTPNRETPAMAG